MAIFNVHDFGAVGNGIVNDRAAIQAALDAAYNAGGGEVYIPTGVYAVTGSTSGNDSGALRVRDNVTVYGDGMGATTIKVIDGWNGKMTGVMRTPYGEGTENVIVRDLTLDGNRANTTGKVDGWFNGYAPGQVGQDTNILLERIEIKDMSGYGFDPHEQTYNLTIRDSVSHGNGLDGFVADYIRGDSVYENNIAYDNDRHGFNIVTSTAGLLLRNNTAYENGSAGIVVQRGSEDIDLVSDVVIEGGQLYGNAKEGIQIKITDGVNINGVSIHDNGTNGIRVFGSTGIVIEGNSIFNNSQSSHNSYAEVRIQDYDETTGVSNLFFDATGNITRNNTIYSDAAVRSSYGIEEVSGRSNFNLFYNNSISGVLKANLLITGPGSQSLTPDKLGTDANNLLNGNSANNMIMAQGGDDSVNGGLGNDSIYGEEGNDTLNGSSGNDLLIGGQGNDSILGGSENDTIFAETGNDTVNAGTGDDFVDGGFGDDSILGNNGNDYIEGWYGADILRGEAGNDTISAGHGNDMVFGGDQKDVLDGGKGQDSLNGGNDTDTLSGGGGRDTLTGGFGADTFKFSSLSHSVLAGGMYDLITDFAASIDKIDVGGLGFNTLTTAPTTVAGELRVFYNAIEGVTYVRSDQSDFTFALTGNVAGTLNNNHFIFSTPINNGGTITGGIGNDTLIGTAADELILGMEGNDSLTGGNGNDTLNGGEGRDTLVGGVGADMYVFSSLTHSVETDNMFDRITGFEVGIDKINLTGLGFTGIDTDGGNTETGELRMTYSSTSNRTYVRSDQNTFEFYMDGDYHTTLTNSDFVFDAPPPPPPPGSSINGGIGDDTLVGSVSDEWLFGFEGNDSLVGGEGNDTLVGGEGRDTLIGGVGADVFVFADALHSVETGNMFDRITGFEVGVDKIDLRGLGFSGIDADGGVTEAGELRLAYSASDRTYVRSDQSTFEFYLDGDYRTTLSNSDFLL